MTVGSTSRAGSAPPSDRGSSPLAYRVSLALAVALLFWSFVGGALYLFAVPHRFPLHVDALDEARWRARRGDTDGALREYRRFASMNPFDAGVRAELGSVLLRGTRLADAAASYEDALRLQPRDPAVLAGLAEVRLAQARYAEAAELYDDAASLLPSNAALREAAGRARALAGRQPPGDSGGGAR